MLRFSLGLIALAAVPCLGQTQVLYSGAATPAGEGWTYVPLGLATETPLGVGVRLDTTASPATYAGYFRSLAPGSLDKNQGFTLTVSAALQSEAHSNPLRAGLSLLVLTSDHTGIELGFHTDGIFAQAEGFATSAESASFSTLGPVTYSLTVAGNGYTLFADDVPLLAGPLRDYSGTATPFGPVYSQEDLIFIGDDTSSAAASFSLQGVTLTVVPEPAGLAPVGLAAAGLLRRRR